MFSSKIEMSKDNKIVIDSNIADLVKSKSGVLKLLKDDYNIEVIININNTEELINFLNSHLKLYDELHFKLNIPEAIIYQFDIGLILRNFMVKNIIQSGNHTKFLLFKPYKLHGQIEKNNYKIFDKFTDDNNQEWNPIFNTFNESLKLNGDLADELNNSLKDNNKLREKISTIKNIIIND